MSESATHDAIEAVAHDSYGRLASLNHKKTSEFKIPEEFVPPPSVAMAAGDKIKPRLADNKEMRKSFIAPFRLWLIFGQTSETKARKLLTRNPRLVMETLVQRASR